MSYRPADIPTAVIVTGEIWTDAESPADFDARKADLRISIDDGLNIDIAIPDEHGRQRRMLVSIPSTAVTAVALAQLKEETDP